MYEKLEGKNVFWVVDGDLAERLRVVQVEPTCLEIVTSTEEDVEKIFKFIQEFSPRPITFETRCLSRNALIEGKEYPVYVRSFTFDFELNGLPVKVQGNLQFKVGDWEWGDVYDFVPDYVYVIGKKIPVAPLQLNMTFIRA